MKHIISLGAGVQSSTMALMAAHGELTPMPECAIFADTQDEPESVYKWLQWLTEALKPAFPVIRVTKGKLSEFATKAHTSASGNKYTNANIPVFLKMPGTEKESMQSRQCTSDFKVRPIQKEIRRLFKWDIAVWRLERRRQKDRRIPIPAPIVQWIGISRDEVHRAKPNKLPYVTNIFPLIDAGMTRQKCLDWMKSNGYSEPPRSACDQCPYHSDKEWLRLKTKEPAEFEKACQFEDRYRQSLAQVARVKGIPFLHRSCVPLREIDFEHLNGDAQPSLFGNECEGMCGV